ncbi:MAG: glycosyltransferase family 2 protein [Methylococcales bacterium]
MNKFVGIVILNWNGVKDTIECIDSVLQATYVNYKIYIIDNGSADNSVDILTKQYSTEDKVKVISTGKNLGFSGGNNVGMRLAMEEGSDYLLLLNNDTEVDPGFLEPMVDVLDNNSDIGVTSGKIYFYNTDKQVWFYGGLMDRDTAVGHAINWREYDTGQINKSRDVDYATGCALMVRREVVETVGYLDDDFFYLCEDAEYCFRVFDAGYRITVVPDSIVWHKVTASLAGGEEAPIRLYFRARNQLLQVLKTKNKKHPYLCWLKLAYLDVKYIVKRIVKGMPLKGTFYFIWGIADFLRGRRGNIPLVNGK